jgi:hypothetical protein
VSGAPSSIGLYLSGRALRQADRLTVSAGITSAAGQGLSGYEDGAWVPRPPFHAIPAPPPGHRGARNRTVGLSRVAPALLERLRADAHKATTPGALSHHLPELLAALSAEWDVVRAPASLSLGRSGAGLATVTRDPDSGALVGLHVDTFGREPDLRARAGNRVSVNIGALPRYFLFIPLTFAELFRRCGARTGEADVVRQFLSLNPQQPVWRLRVNPGEAYIAPTESMIHDAQSPAGCEDLHVTARGVLDPRPC